VVSVWINSHPAFVSDFIDGIADFIKKPLNNKKIKNIWPTSNISKRYQKDVILVSF
jgi:FixJ family two-component response regulator